MQSATFVDVHCVRNVQDNLGRDVHGGFVERLKPGLRHALSVSLGVRGQNGTIFTRDLERAEKVAKPNTIATLRKS